MTREQKRIITLCMVAYTTLYMMRLNVALALTSLGEDLNFELSSLGAITSAFFWCYAIGQLINGRLGDRFSLRWMAFIGLFGSAVFNFCIGLVSSYFLILVFWGINGIFQSMIFSPMIKCIANHFEGKQRVKASFLLSFTQILGYMLAWTISYLLNRYFSWRYVFLVPGAVGLLVAVIWLLFFRESKALSAPSAAAKGKGLLRQRYLPLFLVVIGTYSFLFGLVKNSQDTWLPTMISEVGGFPVGAVILTLLLIPLINFFGLIFSRSIVVKRNGHVYPSILIVWCVATALCAVVLTLLGIGQPLAAVIVTSLLFSSAYSLTPLFTSFVPFDLAEYGYVSTITGFIDFTIYMGASVTGVISTLVLGDDQPRNWSGLVLYWLAILLVGILLAFVVMRCRKWLRSRTEAEREI